MKKAASENLVPVTIEPGGKSPTIVAKGSVKDRTVSAIVWGTLLSGAQTCIAPDYALVHESEINTFIESYDRLVKAAYPDGPISKDYTSIVNDQQYSMLVDLIDDARVHGARIIEVGHRVSRNRLHRPRCRRLGRSFHKSHSPRITRSCRNCLRHSRLVATLLSA